MVTSVTCIIHIYILVYIYDIVKSPRGCAMVYNYNLYGVFRVYVRFTELYKVLSYNYITVSNTEYRILYN